MRRGRWFLGWLIAWGLAGSVLVLPSASQAFTTNPFAGPAGQGNFNFDSTVNFADATILQKNYNLTATGSVTPGALDGADASIGPAVDDDPISKVKRSRKHRK